MSGPPALDPTQIATALNASLRAVDESRIPPPAELRVAVRGTLRAFAASVPGHSVEVRVPPHAAVQCIAGPRHTRGTPKATVEMDGVTWLLLATGRLTFAEGLSAGRVRASGERSDLGRFLPICAPEGNDLD